MARTRRRGEYERVRRSIEDGEEVKSRVEATIRKECSDVNVALLLAAALHAEEEEIRKGRAGEAGSEDAACIVADELIGIDIAEYIGGKKHCSISSITIRGSRGYWGALACLWTMRSAVLSRAA